MTSTSTQFGVDSYLSAVRDWEDEVDAFVCRTVESSAVSTADTGISPLGSVPFAVKDIIDVAGFPTAYGSDAFSDAAASEKESPIVTALRDAGAIPVGKTRTTEFAFIDPTTTRNPYDLRCSPGGSSSGSGAAVGAGMVPFALGTQTAGSLCRPAAYCGAVAYKPGLGVLPTEGVAPLSPSFDAVGVIARSTNWLARVFDVLSDRFSIPEETGYSTSRPLKIGLLRVPEQCPDVDMQSAMTETLKKLRGAGHSVSQVDTPVSFPDIITHHRTIMLQEAAQELGPFIGDRASRLKPLFGKAIKEGSEIPHEERDLSLAHILADREVFWDHLKDFDLLVAYAVPGAAPVGLNTTGDQSYLTPWTAMGGPLVTLQAGRDRYGMPLGILIATSPGSDSRLMRLTAELSGLFPEQAPPVLATV